MKIMIHTSRIEWQKIAALERLGFKVTLIIGGQ